VDTGNGSDTPDQLVRSIFLSALEIASAQERRAYLDRRCGSNTPLRAEVETLLQHQVQMGDYLDRAALDPGATRDPELTPRPLTEDPGTVIGPYKLLEQIGEGGMGVVYMAEQAKPVRRKVALKIIKPGMDTRQVVARFDAERQALALMDHPNIAQVHDAGATEAGRPYFVMELVKGVPITEYCDCNRLAIDERLELFVLVCQAVQHAHQKGIIHRDLKPSNILVTLIDAAAVPKIIDFGVAKAMGQQLTEKTLFTGFAELIGTPLYMSPEQAAFCGVDVDTRSDIYSLGVLLYELLTGTTPFDVKNLRAAGYDEMRRIIREQEPPKPSTRILLPDTISPLPKGGIRGGALLLVRGRRGGKQGLPPSTLHTTVTTPTSGASTISANRQTDPRRLRKSLRGELDWIVMKALEKDRNRRYDTANGFGVDVQRYLAGEPVLAAPPSATYRLRKFARKYRAALATTLAVALLLATGAAVSTWQAVRAIKAEAGARQAAARALQAQQKEAERAEGERQAKQDALAAAAAEKEARAQAQKRLAQIEKSNQIITSIFTDLDIRKVKEGTEPLEAVLAKRLVKAAGDLEGEAVGNPLMVAGLQHRLGETLLSLGRPQEAIPLFVKAIATRKAKLGSDHPDTLSSMNGLAEGYHSAGRLDLAVPLYEETVKVRKAKLGADHPGTLTSMNDLAVGYGAAGKLDLALPLYEQTLKLRKAKLGADHPDTLESMNSLALGYQAARNLDLALPLYQETLKLRKAKLGADHPDTIESMNNLASGYWAAGKLDMAIPLCEETLKLNRAKLGADHPATLTSMNNLAAGYQAARKLDLALPLYEETLKLRKARLGRDHAGTLLSMHNLATGYRDAGKLDRALPLFQEAAVGMEKRRFQYEYAGRIVSHLADCYEQLKQFDRAETWRRKWLAVVKDRSGADSVAYAGELAALGRNLLEQKKSTEAEAALRESLAVLEKKLPDDWSTFNAQSMLGASLFAHKKYAQAEPLLLQGYEGLKARAAKIPAPRQNSLPEAATRIVKLYEAWGKKDTADQWRKMLKTTSAARP